MDNHLRRKILAFTGLIILILIVSGCGRTQGGPPQGTPEVSVMTVQPEKVVITTELPGRVSAFLVADVRPQVSGIIQKRLFNEGADVKAGDVLYQIDPATYKAAYDNARAALARAEANLPSITARFERYKELIADKAVSQQEFDDATAAFKQAQADVEYWKATTASAQINLGYTRITAPISGRIGKSNVTVGALVTANQPSPLAVIQQLDPIYVDATQSSTNLLRLQRNIEAGRIKGSAPGQTRVRLLLEDGTPYPIEGTLKFSDVTVEPTTGSYILRMVFPNGKHMLLPGMYARAVVQEGVIEKGIMVPQQAVLRDPKGNPYTLTVDGSGKVQPRMLTLDRAIGDKWLVASGLAAGDQIIVEGLQRVRPGVTVKSVPFEANRKDTPGPTGNVAPASKVQ